MEGIGVFVFICFAITFGPPILFIILGIARRKSDPSISRVFFIFGTVWLIIGGGICATMLGG